MSLGPLTIKPQDPAPNFKLMAYSIEKELMQVRLDDYPGQYVILLFFPHGTPVDATESKAFSEKLPSFRERGCVVLGITVTSPQALLSLGKVEIDRGGIRGIKFPILCDQYGAMCRDYGVLDGKGVAMRAVVIINRERRVRHVSVYDTRVGRSAKMCLDLVVHYQERERLQLGMPVTWPSTSAAMDPGKS